jgi:hypothetical protein
MELKSHKQFSVSRFSFGKLHPYYEVNLNCQLYLASYPFLDIYG